MQEPQQVNYPANNWSDRNGQAIVAIVVHGTGGALKSSLSTLKTGDGRGVSIHALIAQDGTIYRMVPDEQAANHAGAVTSKFTLNGHAYSGGAVNRSTLGVELVNLQDGRDMYTAPQLASLGWLINHWRALHGPLPVLRHGDLDPTRRRDPYQLTTQHIEQAAAAAQAAPADPFAAWGSVGTPTGVAVGFAVPRAWLVNKKLGKCVAPETYSATGQYSVTEFEAGIILYFKQRNATQVEMFAV